MGRILDELAASSGLTTSDFSYEYDYVRPTTLSTDQTDTAISSSEQDKEREASTRNANQSESSFHFEPVPFTVPVIASVLRLSVILCALAVLGAVCLFRSSLLSEESDKSISLDMLLVVGGITISTIGVFLMYDHYSHKNMREQVSSLQSTLAQYLSSPSHCQGEKQKSRKRIVQSAVKSELEAFLHEDQKLSSKYSPLGSKPIAELYLETTVLFADLSGFTSWSSEREPGQGTTPV
jgi:hypothetical protein